MKPEIASLHERMKKGGDWKTFRDEIVSLHAAATTEEEYVTLLEAHRNLIAVGKYAYNEETYAKLLPVAEAEYKMFLNKESMENDMINPMLLERVTRREVEAGRLAPNDELRKLAVAGSEVLGDTAEWRAHHCKHGNYFFYGMGSAAVLAFGFSQIGFSPLWLIALGLLLGWFTNHHEHKQIKRELVTRRNQQSASIPQPLDAGGGQRG
jgi:hypothetical protein